VRIAAKKTFPFLNKVQTGKEHGDQASAKEYAQRQSNIAEFVNRFRELHIKLSPLQRRLSAILSEFSAFAESH